MKHFRGTRVLLLLALILAGCSGQVRDRDTLYQTSTFSALMEGEYDGPTTFEELASRGDFGIGTFNALDGEMIGVDGKFYQVRSDGKAYPVARACRTPFAAVGYFVPDEIIHIDTGMDYGQLQKYLDESLPNGNFCYGFRIEGTFRYVQTRSVPRQSKPYPRLVEVVKHQPTFEFHNVRGTIVGFRLPKFVNGINVPGYHCHFLTADRSAGGHLLKCRIEKATVEVHCFHQLHLQMISTGKSLTDGKPGEVEKIER